jgi:hypothetical protein
VPVTDDPRLPDGPALTDGRALADDRALAGGAPPSGAAAPEQPAGKSIATLSTEMVTARLVGILSPRPLLRGFR